MTGSSSRCSRRFAKQASGIVTFLVIVVSLAVVKGPKHGFVVRRVLDLHPGRQEVKCGLGFRAFCRPLGLWGLVPGRLQHWCGGGWGGIGREAS